MSEYQMLTELGYVLDEWQGNEPLTLDDLYEIVTAWRKRVQE